MCQPQEALATQLSGHKTKTLLVKIVKTKHCKSAMCPVSVTVTVIVRDKV